MRYKAVIKIIDEHGNEVTHMTKQESRQHYDTNMQAVVHSFTIGIFDVYEILNGGDHGIN